jgi:tRNA-modifying protein YgfZ
LELAPGYRWANPPCQGMLHSSFRLRGSEGRLTSKAPHFDGKTQGGPVTKVSLLPDRVVCKIGGGDAHDFLQNLLTNNLERVSPTRAIYTLLQTPQGKYLFDFFIVERDGHYLIDCDRDAAPELLKRLMFYKLRADVTLASMGEEWVVGAVWDNGMSGDAGQGEQFHGGLRFNDPRLSALGQRFMVPAAAADTALAAGEISSHDEYDAHRIALAVPGAQDLIADKTFPMEANLDLLGAIDFQKGCFVGQEVTSRTYRKGQVRKRIVTVRANADLPAPHTAVMAGERQAGELLSSAGAQGLALLRLDRLDNPLTADKISVEASLPGWLSDATTQGTQE